MIAIPLEIPAGVTPFIITAKSGTVYFRMVPLPDRIGPDEFDGLGLAYATRDNCRQDEELWSIRGRYSPFVALSVDGSGLVMIRPSVLEGELTDDPDVVFMYRSGELVRSYRFSDVSMPDSQMAWPGTGKIVWADGRIVGGFDADNEFSDILFAVPGSGSFRVFWSGRNASVVNENRGVIEGPLPSTGEVHLRESEYAISHLEWHPVHAIGGIVVGLVIAWCYRLIRGGRGVA